MKEKDVVAEQPHDLALVEASEAFPSCTLDEVGWREQRDRYARLATSVLELRHDGQAIEADLAEGFDRPTLDALISVETECCPFFVFAFDDASRRLRVTVEHPDQRSALDAVAHAFGAAT